MLSWKTSTAKSVKQLCEAMANTVPCSETHRINGKATTQRQRPSIKIHCKGEVQWSSDEGRYPSGRKENHQRCMRSCV